MVQTYISSEHEVFEIINQFPVLETVFNELKLDISNLGEYMTLGSFLKGMNLFEEEISLIINKLNLEVNHFLNNGTLMQPKILKPVNEVLDIEMIQI